jgi:Helix-hairpin-helix motif
MKKGFVLLFLVLISLNFIVAECVDINSASLSELDELSGVGEVIAGRIIDGRPFDSIDDLIDIERIGDVTLEKIKEQGLACVDCDCEGEVEEGVKKGEKIVNVVGVNVVEEIDYNPHKEAISLVPKDIKSEEVLEKSDGDRYATYGLVGFCVVLFLLYASKYYRNDKNEFE